MSSRLNSTACDTLSSRRWKTPITVVCASPPANETGYETLIIADHGNADYALNPDGTPNTAHSLNPVPLIYVTQNKQASIESGILADVAPSLLHIMGLPQPAEMTGRDLIKD